MDTPTSNFQIYNELADWYEQKGPPAMRDRFLVLAADAAMAAGDIEVAEHLRERLLQFNPHHLLRAYTSFVQAAGAADVQTQILELRNSYPPKAAWQLLLSLRDREAPTERRLPPTAPLIHIEEDEVEGTAFLEPMPERLKVYPMRHEVDQTEILPPARPTRPLRDTTPPPRTAVPTRPPASTPTTPAPHSHKSVPARNPIPPALPPTPALRRPTIAPPPSVEPEEPAHGSWLGVVLCGVVVVIGTLLAGYSLLRPILPATWLP